MAYLSDGKGYITPNQQGPHESKLNLMLSGMIIQTTVQGDRSTLSGSIEVPAKELILPTYDNDPLAVEHIENGYTDTSYFLKSGLQGNLTFDQVVAWIESQKNHTMKGMVELNGRPIENEGFYGVREWTHPYGIEMHFEGNDMSIEDLREPASSKFTFQNMTMDFSEWVERGKPKQLPLEIRITL